MTAGADGPTDRVRSVQSMVKGMQSALVAGDLASGTTAADEIVAVTTDLLEELDLDRHHDCEPNPELIATLRVYRNAAFAFRKLADVGGGTDSALLTACAALIDQGQDHFRAYLGGGPE